MAKINKYGEIEDTTCSACGNPVKMEWVTCPLCSQNLGRNLQQKAGSEDYTELKKWCKNAVILLEESLMGIDREHQSNISVSYAPFIGNNYEKWRKAAEAGIPEGQFLHGQILIQNNRCEEGFKFLKAALTKYPPSKRALGDCMIDHGNREEGLRLLTEVADSGDAIACYILALRYENFVSVFEFKRLMARDHVLKQKDQHFCGGHIVEFKEKHQRYMRRAAALGNNHAKSFIKLNEAVSFMDFSTSFDIKKVIE